MQIVKAALLYCVLGAAAFALPASAKDAGPCHDDIQKFCKDMKPGGGAVAQCLKQHESELSQACKEKGEELKRKAGEFKEACGEDARKFCKDAKHGHGGVVKCLRAHEPELSAQCKSKLGDGK